MQRAASAYTTSPVDSTDSRSKRAQVGMEEIPTAIMTFTRLWPRMLTIASARRISDCITDGEHCQTRGQVCEAVR